MHRAAGIQFGGCEEVLPIEHDVLFAGQVRDDLARKRARTRAAPPAEKTAKKRQTFFPPGGRRSAGWGIMVPERTSVPPGAGGERPR